MTEAPAATNVGPSPIRALHFYAGQLFGGVEVLLVRLHELRALMPGVRHDFALCFEGLLAERLRQAGATVTVLGPARFSRPWTVWRVRRKLRDLLVENRPDVLVCHEVWNHAIGAPVARKLGIRLVTWHHSDGAGSPVRTSLRRWPPDLAIACSKYVAGKLRERYRGAATPIEVAYCPLRRSAADASEKESRVRWRQELGLDAETIAILQLGRLSEYKGHLDTLEALARLRNLPVRLLVVGGVQQPAEARFLQLLRRTAERLGIQSLVQFRGHADNVGGYYAACDIFCQPNTRPEPFGMVFVEAMSAGLPVVTYDHGGASEILRDAASGVVYGILVPPNDVAALTVGLRDVMSQPALRSRLSGAAPARAAELCDTPKCLGRIEAILLQAAGAKTR